LEAMPVMVGERELRAGVRALAPDDHPRALGPAAQIEELGDLAHLPVGAIRPVLIDRRDPGALWDLEDRGADGLGQVIADRELDLTLAAPVQQLVASAGAINAKHDLERFDVLGGDLRDRLLSDGDLVSGVVRARVAGAQHPSERLTALIAIREHRSEPVAPLERARGPVLLGMRGDQRGVQIDRQPLRRAGQLPDPCTRPRVSPAQSNEQARRGGDPINHPERRRRGRGRPEQHGLITNGT
jgi:hypothetical protein